MSKDTITKVDTQIAEVQKEFESLGSKHKELSEQRAVLDRQLAAVRNRQLQLQGEYQGLQKLKGEPVKDIPVEAPAEKPRAKKTK